MPAQFRHVRGEAPAGIQHARLVVVRLPGGGADVAQQRGADAHQARLIGGQRRE